MARCATSPGRSRAIAELALITARDEADALELVRHDYAHVLAEAVQNLFPGTQITFGPATDDGFYYDFAPAARARPVHRGGSARRSRRRCGASSRADEPLVREVWTRERGARLSSRSRARRFKAEWVMELPEDETITMYRSGGWLDLCRGPHLASTGKLDPAGVQADPRLGRLLARRPEQRAAVAHLRHRLAQQEAARGASRPARGGGQARPSQDRPGDGPVPPPGRGARLGLLAPQGLSSSGASSKPICAAGSTPPAIDEVKTPQLMDARQWEQSGHWGKYRENMFVVPDEVPEHRGGRADPLRRRPT